MQSDLKIPALKSSLPHSFFHTSNLGLKNKNNFRINPVTRKTVLTCLLN